MTITEDIEKIFIDEIREKKRTGRGAFAMRGKGVKHGMSGALKTPYHFMSNKERKKLDGEVTVANMYETIVSWKEFELKDKETQRNLLTRWREIYPNQKIMDDLGQGMGKKFNSQSYSDLVNSLGCPPKTRGGSKYRKAGITKKEKVVSISPQVSMLEIETEEKASPGLKLPEIQQETIKTMLVTNGLHLEYNGTYDIDSLSRLFTKLQLLIDGETSKYHISISLSEVPEEKA